MNFDYKSFIFFLFIVFISFSIKAQELPLQDNQAQQAIQYSDVNYASSVSQADSGQALQSSVGNSGQSVAQVSQNSAPVQNQYSYSDVGQVANIQNANYNQYQSAGSVGVVDNSVNAESVISNPVQNQAIYNLGLSVGAVPVSQTYELQNQNMLDDSSKSEIDLQREAYQNIFLKYRQKDNNDAKLKRNADKQKKLSQKQQQEMLEAQNLLNSKNQQLQEYALALQEADALVKQLKAGSDTALVQLNDMKRQAGKSYKDFSLAKESLSSAQYRLKQLLIEFTNLTYGIDSLDESVKQNRMDLITKKQTEMQQQTANVQKLQEIYNSAKEANNNLDTQVNAALKQFNNIKIELRKAEINLIKADKVYKSAKDELEVIQADFSKKYQ